jgi:predicted metal-dependent enzyme (double-stranded beta helix superfamily)
MCDPAGRTPRNRSPISSAHLPGPGILAPDQRLGQADRAAGHLPHTEPDGAFSILGLVWRPGQTIRIHDHITWCVVGVLLGNEHEELFDEALNPVGTRDNPPGAISGFAPPGDIHRIRNVGDETAISLHSYGTDIARVGAITTEENHEPARHRRGAEPPAQPGTAGPRPDPAGLRRRHPGSW